MEVLWRIIAFYAMSPGPRPAVDVTSLFVTSTSVPTLVTFGVQIVGTKLFDNGPISITASLLKRPSHPYSVAPS